MEINQVYNRELKEKLVNTGIGLLLDNQLITQEDFPGLSVEMGYVFSTDEDQIEALFKIGFPDKEFFFAAQKGKFMMVNINDEMFSQTVAFMSANHPCIQNNELPETKIQKKRREKNNKFAAKKKITTADRLMTRWNDDSVVLKDLGTICRRAVACFFVIQIACDIGKNNYQEGLNYFKPMLEKFGLMDQLNSKEQRIVDGTYSMQDAIDMDWAYEAYWALCWSLGLVKDISDASNVCDCDKAIGFVMKCNSIEEFAKKCKLRSKEDILDMLDLYFRYNWAINDAKVNQGTSLGALNPSVVIERRRGLEWIVSEEPDWYDLTLPA